MWTDDSSFDLFDRVFVVGFRERVVARGAVIDSGPGGRSRGGREEALDQVLVFGEEQRQLGASPSEEAPSLVDGELPIGMGPGLGDPELAAPRLCLLESGLGLLDGRRKPLRLTKSGSSLSTASTVLT